MILKRIALEHYGCFGSAEFEFRRGMNLVAGGNESGKSLLLAAVPAALLGIDHGSRLRSWGDSLSCRVTLLFDGTEGGLRLMRDLENNLVRIEECGADGAWQETFAGMVPPAGTPTNRADYLKTLARCLPLGNEMLLRCLLDPGCAEALCLDDGRRTAGLVAEVTANAGESVRVPEAVSGEIDPKERQREIAALEAELAVDRADSAKGEKYLAWIKKKYGLDGSKPPAARNSGSKVPAQEQSALVKRREELEDELKRHGLPANLPEALPGLFDEAGKLRQELASLQVELTPLQRRRQSLTMPGAVWPMLFTLAGSAAVGGAYWIKAPWLLPLGAGCGAAVLLAWSVFLVRFNRARGVRETLERELQTVEQKRAVALARQSELAEQFEAYGLSSTPVEMVKLQQLYTRNEELIRRYRDVCGQLGEDAGETRSSAAVNVDDRHLRPEEIPDAEARLAELCESVRRREVRLAALRSGPLPTPPAHSAAPSVWSEKLLLQNICEQMERLTGGRRYDLRLQDGRLQLEAMPGKWAVPSSCSRGTVECLVLAIRLTLSRLAGGKLPLPVDDLPAHLDSRRRQAALLTLERHAADHQLLLASSDEELARRAVRERWHIVRLNSGTLPPTVVTEEKADAGQLHLL